VRDVITINDVIVPIPLALLQSSTRKLEASQPSTALLRVLGKRKLSGIVVPRAKQVYRLAVAGCAKRKVKLDCGHCSCGPTLISFL